MALVGFPTDNMGVLTIGRLKSNTGLAPVFDLRLIANKVDIRNALFWTSSMYRSMLRLPGPSRANWIKFLSELESAARSRASPPRGGGCANPPTQLPIISESIHLHLRYLRRISTRLDPLTHVRLFLLCAPRLSIHSESLLGRRPRASLDLSITGRPYCGRFATL